jgi:alanine racemase
VGDEVILFGPPAADAASQAVTVDEVAAWMDTINYEVTCLIGRRVPRAYMKNGFIQQVQNYLLPRE